MKYAFTEYRKRENTALNKAPEDVLRVAEKLGFVQYDVKSCAPRSNGFMHKVIARLAWSIEGLRISLRMKSGDVVLLQAPPAFFCRKAGRDFLVRLHKRGVRFIYLIHDIGELRESNPSTIGLARAMLDWTLNISDIVIAHNPKMKSWLIDRGVPADQIVELGIFDYLCDLPPQHCSCRKGSNDVIIAGNLSADKSAYLSGLKSVAGVNWKLYGPNFDRERLVGDGSSSNIEYCGSFDPAELPLRMSGSWGLVWDGNSVDTCSGATGDYLRYNNPHKLSLFLACGIPVIIWSEAAEAEFVKANNVGVAVKSLRGICEAISVLNSSDMHEVKKALSVMSAQIRSGVYTRVAISAALQKIETSN